MLSPKNFLFYKFCVIIVALVTIIWWIKVPEEEVKAADDTPELIHLKELINETGSSKQRPIEPNYGRK